MRHFIFCILLNSLFLTAHAQKIEEFFIKMPNELIVHLEEAWRKDLVGLYKAGKPATLENTMQGKSTLQKLTDDYLLLKSTERSVVELKLLPLINNTLIICMVQTVYGPVADSRIAFFTTDWKPLASDELFTPVTEDWFWKEDADREALNYLPQQGLFLMKYSLSENELTLTAEYTTPSTLDEENQRLVRSFLKSEPKIYGWKSGRFE